MTNMLVFTLHLKVDAKLTSKLRVTPKKCQKEKIMTLKEAIRKDGQRHLYRQFLLGQTNR